MLRNKALWRCLKQTVPSSSLSRALASSASPTNNLITLSVNDKTGIATLELNRPPVNSLNTALLQDISSALDDVTKNRSKGLILTSVRNMLYCFQIVQLLTPISHCSFIFSLRQVFSQPVWTYLNSTKHSQRI